MIMMRIFLPLPTFRSRGGAFVWAGLGMALIASCGVDQSGLNSMPFLPHDASAPDTASPGVAGISGTAGSPGTAGRGGAGGNAGSVTGVAGMGGTAAGTGGVGGAAAGTGGGVAGTGGTTSGTAGANATGGSAAAGTGGSNTAGAGGDGTAGVSGTAGIGGTSGGTAGTVGTAGAAGGGTAGAGGSAGSGGSDGTAGTVGTGGDGTAGASGTAGAGGSSGGVTGTGGRGGTGGGGGICNALNCLDGCCAGGTCVRQRTVTQCGANGQACAPCGGCQFCSGTGQCRIETTSRWTIVAVAAQLDNSGWDRFSGELGGTAPDPFCEYENPAGQVSNTTAGVTDTIIDTYNPTWNQVITPPGMTVSAATLMASNPAWQIWVGDDDGCPGGTGCEGEVACTIRQPITETNLRSGQLIVSNRQNCNSVTINFVCQPPVASDEVSEE
jgi:hypothetical protein